jgi:hypothetical protein
MALKALDQRMATKPAAVPGASTSGAGVAIPAAGAGAGSAPSAISPRTATVASLGGQSLASAGTGDMGEGIELESKK